MTSTASVLTAGAAVGDELVIPINHFSGNYTCDADTLRTLHDEERIVLRYADNPNGSVDAIAGIANEEGNVVGLMPHPERASAALLGSVDGLVLLRSLWPPRCAADGHGAGAGSALPAAQARAREISAFWRTAALTPAARQVEYVMPLRSP